MEARAVRGTFFLSPYESSPEAEAKLAHAAREIHSRGHDLQLHTHPAPVFGIYQLSKVDLETQVKILRHGRDLIQKWTGKRVIAHRAGGVAANLDTMEAC